MVEFFADLIESVTISSFYIMYFGMKEKNAKNIFLSFILMLSADLAVSELQLNIIFQTFIFIGISVFMQVLFLKGKIGEKILVSAIVFIMIALISIGVTAMMSKMLNANYSSIVAKDGHMRTISLFVTKMLLILGLLLMFLMKKKTYGDLKDTEVLFIIVCNTISIYLINKARLEIIEYKQNYSVFLYLLMEIIIMNIVIFYLMYIANEKNRKQKEINDSNLKLEKMKYETANIKKSYDEAMKIKHDMKHYVNLAITLLNEKKYDDLKKHLEEFSSDQIGSIKKYIYTENLLIDAVINTKMSIAEKNKIKFEMVYTHKIKKEYESDISILLSNLLDNAIEACNNLQSDNRFIRLSMYNKKSYYCIEVINSSATHIIDKNPDLKTTKKDTQNHGYGVKSCRDIIEKYNGMEKFENSNNEFKVRIMLDII